MDFYSLLTSQTNINKSSAWKKGQQTRLKKATEIKNSFVCPDKVVVHWDGKMLKLRGQISSNRVCIYLSGIEALQTRKLLGIPEAKTGKGSDEFELVRELMVKWEVKEQTVGMVFDTTATNTGRNQGACR